MTEWLDVLKNVLGSNEDANMVLQNAAIVAAPRRSRITQDNPPQVPARGRYVTARTPRLDPGFRVYYPISYLLRPDSRCEYKLKISV